MCEVLRINNSREAKKSIDQRSVSTTDVKNSAGFMRQTVVINESGLYDMILDSPQSLWRVPAHAEHPLNAADGR